MCLLYIVFFVLSRPFLKNQRNFLTILKIRVIIELSEFFAHSRKEEKMKIAVTYENGNVFQHFGHTEQFKVYETADGKVTGSEVIDTNGSGHGALAGLLSGLNIDTLICGGIGAGAQTALAEAGINLYGGVSGSADDAVNALLAGTLAYNPDVRCSHHEHHGEEHHCGENKHGCGGNGGSCHQ